MDTKMDHKNIEWLGIDKISLAQDTEKWWALVNLFINFQAP